MQTDKTGVTVQTQLKTKPRRTLLKLNKGMKWTPGHIFMLYYAVWAVFAKGELAAYNISTSTLHKHVEVT